MVPSILNPKTMMFVKTRPPTIDIRLKKQKIRLNSDSFLTKNQTKFRLIGEKFRLKPRIYEQLYNEQKMGPRWVNMQLISKHNLNMSN